MLGIFVGEAVGLAVLLTNWLGMLLGREVIKMEGESVLFVVGEFVGEYVVAIARSDGELV